MTGAVEPAVGASACCGRATRRSMSDYIDQGMRRRRAAPLPIAGAVHHDAAGRFVRFTMRVEGGVIAAVAFEASACVTLVAYCELAAERVMGVPVRTAAARVCPGDLASELPYVPFGKRDRALLAARAAMAAVVECAKEPSV